jgi:hypothetical protein
VIHTIKLKRWTKRDGLNVSGARESNDVGVSRRIIQPGQRVFVRACSLLKFIGNSIADLTKMAGSGNIARQGHSRNQSESNEYNYP